MSKEPNKGNDPESETEIPNQKLPVFKSIQSFESASSTASAEPTFHSVITLQDEDLIPSDNVAQVSATQEPSTLKAELSRSSFRSANSEGSMDKTVIAEDAKELPPTSQQRESIGETDAKQVPKPKKKKKEKQSPKKPTAEISPKSQLHTEEQITPKGPELEMDVSTDEQLPATPKADRPVSSQKRAKKRNIPKEPELEMDMNTDAQVPGIPREELPITTQSRAKKPIIPKEMDVSTAAQVPGMPREELPITSQSRAKKPIIPKEMDVSTAAQVPAIPRADLSDEAQLPAKESVLTIRSASEQPTVLRPTIKEDIDTHGIRVRGDQESGKKSGPRVRKRRKADIYAEVPKDRGFAWFIVFLTFFAQCCVDGTLFTIQFMLAHIAKDLHLSPSVALTISSIQVCFFYFAQPFVFVHINTYGCRIVSFLGGILAGIAFYITSIATHILLIIPIYSIVGGAALCMIATSSQTVLGYYFTKYRAIATGIASSGAGAGIMAYSYVNATMISYIDWRYLIQFNAVAVTFVGLASLAFRQLAPTKIAELVFDSDSEDDEGYEQGGTPTHKPASFKKLKAYFGDMVTKVTPSKKKKGKDANAEEEEEAERVVLHATPLEKQDVLYTGPPQYEERDNSSHIDIAGDDVNMTTTHRDSIRNIHHTLSMLNMTKEGHNKLAIERRHKSFVFNIVTSFLPKDCVPERVRKAYGMEFKFRLFNKSEFLILMLSTFLYSAGFNIPYVYSLARARYHPLYHKVLIIIFIGLADTVIRNLCGLLSNQFVNQVTYIFGGGLILSGLVTFVSGYYGRKELYAQYFYSAMFSIAPAFHNTLRSIVYVRFLGVQNLTSALGLTAMGMSIGVLGGTTFATVLYYSTGTLTATFMFSGACLMGAGIIPILLPYMVKQPGEWKRRTETELA